MHLSNELPNQKKAYPQYYEFKQQNKNHQHYSVFILYSNQQQLFSFMFKVANIIKFTILT